MKRNTMKRLGWAMAALGIVGFLVCQLLAERYDIRALRSVGMGLLGLGVGGGATLLRGSWNEQRYKKYQTEQRDERLLAIECRASRIALYTTWALLLVVNVWQSAVGNEALGYAAIGLLALSAVVLVTAEAVLKERM